MSAPRFSSGPWYPGHLGNPDTSCECRYILDEGHAGGIAEVYMDNGIALIGEGRNDCPPREQAIANMHLIAAAPDLYAALFGLVRDLDLEEDDAMQAMAALAKARGEQP